MVVARTLIAVVALAVACTLLIGGGQLRRGGSAASSGVPTMAAPSEYHITYEVMAPGQRASTEQLWVRRPFDSVDVTLDGPPPGTTTFLTQVTRLGRRVVAGHDSAAAQLSGPVAPPPVDARLDAVLPAAVRGHRLEVRARSTVAGRPCTVIRSAGALRGGPLAPLSGARTYTDTCVDRGGLILDERAFADGHLTTERRAVSVDDAPGAGVTALSAMNASPTPENQGGGAIAAVTATSWPPGPTWRLAGTPPGFEAVGRYAVEPPQPGAFAGPGLASTNPAGAPSLVVAIDDVFVRGADVIVVEQGETMNGAHFSPPSDAQPADLGGAGLGPGQLVLGATASVVSAEPGSHFVRVTGTVDPDLLVSVARGLRSVDDPASALVTIPGAVP